MVKKAPVQYKDIDILRLYKKKDLGVSQIAKIYRMDPNVVRRVLLDNGVKLDDMDDMIGKKADYTTKRSNRRIAMTAIAMVFVATFIGALSLTQEGSLFGQSKLTGAVVYDEPQRPQCLYECCDDENHETKLCPEGQECIKWHCQPEGTYIEGEA
ncbi:MAG: hypothetical protein KJ709_07005 [Nanoarchaeota archaeon]|nr:hypothetical protein [Nanoarchaeota archaeon]